MILDLYNYVETESLTSYRSFIHSTQYASNIKVFPKDLHYYDAPCVVCFVPKVTSVMIPAQISCPNGWTLEYSGYLMSNSEDNHSSGTVCVDGDGDNLEGSAENKGGEVLYFIVASCGASFLPCPPYIFFLNKSQ